MLRSIAGFIALFAFWLIMSGIFTPFLIASGAGCALVVMLLATRMQIADREGAPLDLTVSALTYLPWLLKEIFVSGCQVTWIILHPKLPIDPIVTRFKPSQTTTLGLVTHANSITMTPGTITMEANHDELCIHALTARSAEALPNGEMDRRASLLEGRKWVRGKRL